MQELTGSRRGGCLARGGGEGDGARRAAGKCSYRGTPGHLECGGGGGGAGDGAAKTSSNPRDKQSESCLDLCSPCSLSPLRFSVPLFSSPATLKRRYIKEASLEHFNRSVLAGACSARSCS